MDRLTFEELTDTLPGILMGMADALASSDPDEIRQLVAAAPLQGLSRLRLRYDVIEVMQEDRLLRAVIVLQVERGMNRQMNPAEAAALHAVVDVMMKRSVIALVSEKESQIRAATERELKYLSFLSHDLTNHLSVVSMNLQLLRMRLGEHPEFAAEAKMAATADREIRGTMTGMRRLLEHETLRKTVAEPKSQRLDLHEVATDLIGRFSRDANAKGLTLHNDVRANAVTTTDPEMILLVLQNLLGNAVKYCENGNVRITCDCEPDHAVNRWVLSVVDEGPGIAAEDVSRIFGAFQRGERHGQQGLGLGLAIANQAAKLLGAELAVESTLGRGSTFSLKLPLSSTSP